MTAQAILLEEPVRLPSLVNVAVADRRVRMLSAANGRVLDLSLAEDRALLHDEIARGDAAQPATAPQAELFDLVLSTADLVLFPDLRAAVRAVHRLLRPDGELWAVEPTSHPGMAATALTTLWLWHPMVRRAHVERDIPATVRASGLEIYDLERFTVPTTCWPLRQFVQLIAARRDGER